MLTGASKNLLSPTLLLGLLCVATIYSREIEIYVGPKVFEARNLWSNSYSKTTTLELAESKELENLNRELRKTFSETGGIDLLGRSSSMRAAWISSSKKAWLIQLTSQQDTSKTTIALQKAGWQLARDGSFQREDFTTVVKSNKIIFGRGLSTADLLRESLIWNIPANEWLSIKIQKPFFEEFARRSPRSDAFVSKIVELYLTWDQGDLVLNMQLNESKQASSLLLGVNGIIQFLSNAVRGGDVKSAAGWEALDFVAYSSQSLNALAFQQILRRINCEAFGKIFQLRYVDVGDLGVFLSSSMPRIMMTLLVTAAPYYIEHKSKITALLGATSYNNPAAFSNDSKSTTVEPCQAEIEVLQQAVEFYNLDHLKKGKFEDIKTDLFSNGYLPQDFTCGDILIRESNAFRTDSEGKIRFQPQ